MPLARSYNGQPRQPAAAVFSVSMDRTSGRKGWADVDQTIRGTFHVGVNGQLLKDLFERGEAHALREPVGFEHGEIDTARRHGFRRDLGVRS